MRVRCWAAHIAHVTDTQHEAAATHPTPDPTDGLNNRQLRLARTAETIGLTVTRTVTRTDCGPEILAPAVTFTLPAGTLLAGTVIVAERAGRSMNVWRTRPGADPLDPAAREPITHRQAYLALDAVDSLRRERERVRVGA